MRGGVKIILHEPNRDAHVTIVDVPNSLIDVPLRLNL